MDPQALWNEVTDQLKALADDAATDLAHRLPHLVPEPSVTGTVLDPRLLTPVDALPPGNSLVELVREILGDLGAGSPVRLHGWQRAPGSALGVALVVADPTGTAVLAVTPGGPVVDIVVTPGTALTVQRATGPWTAGVTLAAPLAWDVAVGPGLPPPPPGGTATITLTRSGHLQAGLTDGPGLSVEGVRITVSATPAGPAAVDVELREVRAAVLPAALARLLGAGAGTPMAPQDAQPVTLTARADRASGLRFPTTGLPRVGLPLRIDAPGVRTRGAALELRTDDGRLHLGLLLSVAAGLPALPLHVALDDAGVDLPVALSPGARLGIDPRGLRDLFPEGIGTELALPPVSGGGVVRRTPDGGYAGLISVDLGFLRLQAIALFRPPAGGAPTSFLVVLAAQFPAPGVQLGLGFALDAVGGLVGINRRVDVDALRGLVSDGNADRVLFPDSAVERAGQIIEALRSAYPVAAGRFLIGPMLRITWGGRMVSLSGGLVLEMPAPVRAVLVGRLLVAVPDPDVPLIRLQASVLGRVDPGVPVVELLVSLAGSWIVGLAVRGEIYLLIRGGGQPEFVLSAGGFHPRYVRPAGVPALQRLSLDLAPGGSFGLRMEAYFALTSNSLQFGGQVQLEAMIAGCGVEGWLGLDALFVFDPFAFSVHVRAGIAVRAFGRRLASVGLDFTLEGPAPWHAFGTGSISVLFWDVDLDFDVHWGSPPPLEQARGRDPGEPLKKAIARSDAWAAERPAAERTGLVFTPDATAGLAQGTLVHPDATLRVSQSVLPLGVPIRRFERRPVPEQTWTIAAVNAGGPLRPETLPSLPERFVPGEFFELTDDQEFTAPAFETLAGGVRISVDDGQLGTGHLVDDGYETGYKPPPPEQPREFRLWPGLFGLEAVAGVGAAERLERWRPRDVAVRLRPPRLAVASVAGLTPLASDVSLVSATTDAWQTLQGQVGPAAGGVQLLEQWELQA